MTAVIASIALLCASCAPAARSLGRCPTVYLEGADFTLSATGLAGSVAEYNLGRPLLSAGLAIAAMSLALADNLSECRK